MPSNKVESTKRMGTRAVEDDVLATAHNLTAALHRVHAIIPATSVIRNVISVTPDVYRDTIRAALLREFGGTRHGPKLVSRIAKVSVRTAQNWLDGMNGPQGAALIMLAAHSAEVNQAIMDLMSTARGESAPMGHALRSATDDPSMHEMDRLCPPPWPDYVGPEVRRIRAATRMSQPMFAQLLGVDESAVAQWERGAKRPSGPALRLLEMLDPDKPDSPVVQVRRGMTDAA